MLLQDWGFWAVLVALVSAVIALAAKRESSKSSEEANKAQRTANELQARLVAIEEERRHEEITAAQVAQVEAIAHPKDSSYELIVWSRGPGTASDVRIEICGSQLHDQSSRKSMPIGARWPIDVIPKNWNSSRIIGTYTVHWRHPSGKEDCATFYISPE